MMVRGKENGKHQDQNHHGKRQGNDSGTLSGCRSDHRRKLCLPDQRKVLVQRFESTMEPNWWDKLWGKKNVVAVDQYLKTRADEKDELINSIKNLFKK